MKKSCSLFLSVISASILLLSSCKKELNEDSSLPEVESRTAAKVLTGEYKSDQKYNLNVIYFLPKDMQKPADHHRRISEILLKAQDFFGKEMQRNGYGFKTFGLLKNAAKTRIKLIEIKGSQGKDAYPYEGGANAVIKDIEDYKAAHPTEFNSLHNLIILPATVYDANGWPGGVPFYGLGKSCFALDYADQDIKYLTAENNLGDKARVWIGGMIHELGHGLNLPHNRQKFQSEKSLGMALMFAGNGTWGYSPTFLTAADCATLNTNQCFNKDETTYYGQVDASLIRLFARYDENKRAIIISGKYRSDVPLTNILYYNDPNLNSNANDLDYNAIAWTSKPIKNDSFYVEMPIIDLEYKADNVPYQLRVKLAHKNGVITEYSYSYTFLNGKPVITFGTLPNEKNKQRWKVVSFSSEENGGEGLISGRAVRVLDADQSTFWHSKWTSGQPAFPHQFVIDMGRLETAKGVSIIQRANNATNIKDAQLFVSSDGVRFTLVGNYVFAETGGSQQFNFTAAKRFRYFKLVATSSWDGHPHAALAEIGMY